MKKILRNVFAVAVFGFAITGCSSDDKLDNTSYLPTEDDVLVLGVDSYLNETFVKPWNMQVHYKWDRNIYGPTRDNNRNLYPPRYENVKPAMEMVDLIWIQSYVEVAGKEFVNKIRPGQLLLAGGYALNEDGTRTLGLASGGVQITLYEADFLEIDLEAAKEFIHTIQHEYIHIINQDTEFDQPEFGAKTMGGYTPQWYEIPSTLDENRWGINNYSNLQGFVTGYARSNIFEDFAETASYLLTHTEQEYADMLTEIRSIDNLSVAQRETLGLTPDIYQPGGAEKIEYKVQLVKDYFKKAHKIDFEELIRVANRNALNSPMLNRPDNGNNGIVAPFGTKSVNAFGKQQKVLRFCQGHADALLQQK